MIKQEKLPTEKSVLVLDNLSTVIGVVLLLPTDVSLTNNESCRSSVIDSLRMVNNLFSNKQKKNSKSDFAK